MNENFEKGIQAYHDKNYSQDKGPLKALEDDRYRFKLNQFLGNSCYFAGDYDEAILHLKKCLELYEVEGLEKENVPYVFDSLGKCYEALGKENLAIDCYNNAIKVNPSCASAWHNMGLLYTKSAKYYIDRDLSNSLTIFRGAQKFLQKAFGLANNNPAFLNSIASWYESYIEALKKLTDPMAQESINSCFKLANEYYSKAFNACDVSDIKLKEIIKGNLVECLAQHGHFLYKNDLFDDARDIYLKTLALSSGHLPSVNQVGMCFFRQKNYVDARKYFEMILTITQDKQEHADAWLNIACAFRFEKNLVEAEIALNTAEKLSPQDPEIKNEREKLKETISVNSLNNFGNRFLSPNSPLIKDEVIEDKDCNSYFVSDCR